MMEIVLVWLQEWRNEFKNLLGNLIRIFHLLIPVLSASFLSHFVCLLVLLHSISIIVFKIFINIRLPAAFLAASTSDSSSFSLSWMFLSISDDNLTSISLEIVLILTLSLVILSITFSIFSNFVTNSCRAAII